MIALIDRLMGIYCPDVPLVRAAVELVLEEARKEGEQRVWAQWFLIGVVFGVLSSPIWVWIYGL